MSSEINYDDDRELDKLIEETRNIWDGMANVGGSTGLSDANEAAVMDDYNFDSDLGGMSSVGALLEAELISSANNSALSFPADVSALASRHIEGLDLEAAGSLKYESEAKRTIRSKFFTPKVGIDRNNRSRVNLEMPSAHPYSADTFAPQPSQSADPLLGKMELSDVAANAVASTADDQTVDTSVSGFTDLLKGFPDSESKQSDNRSRVKLEKRGKKDEEDPLIDLDEENEHTDEDESKRVELPGSDSATKTGDVTIEIDTSPSTAALLQSRSPDKKRTHQRTIKDRFNLSSESEDLSSEDRRNNLRKTIDDLDGILEGGSKFGSQTTRHSSSVPRYKSPAFGTSVSVRHAYEQDRYAKKYARFDSTDFSRTKQFPAPMTATASRLSAPFSSASALSSSVFHSSMDRNNLVDLNQECWNEVNELLVQCGFPILVKETDANLKTIPVSDTISETMTRVLKGYHLIRKDNNELQLSIDAWKQKCEQTMIDNKSYMKEVKSLKQRNQQLRMELDQMKQQLSNSQSIREAEQSGDERKYSHLRSKLELDKQLSHSKEQLKQREKELEQTRKRLAKMERHKDNAERDADKLAAVMDEMKVKYEHTMQEKEHSMEQEVRKYQQQLERLRREQRNQDAHDQAYQRREEQKMKDATQERSLLMDSERNVLQKEIGSLRHELRSLHKRLLDSEGSRQGFAHTRSIPVSPARRRRKPHTQSSVRVKFTASAQASEDEEQGSNIPAKARRQRPFTTSVSPKKGRRKDLSSGDIRDCELSILEKETKTMAQEISDLQFVISEKDKVIGQLNESLRGRPSKQEWLRLRHELAGVSKELRDSKATANIRKYMDTRELIRRDKEIFVLNLDQISHIPKDILQEIIVDLCRLFSISDITELTNKCKQVCKLSKSVPILESFIERIVRAMLKSEHCPKMSTLKRSQPKLLFDQVIPTIEEWTVKLDKISTLEAFRLNSSQILKKRRISVAGTLSEYRSHPSPATQKLIDEPLAMHEMLTHIRQLVQSEDYLLGAKGALLLGALNSDADESSMDAVVSSLGGRIDEGSLSSMAKKRKMRRDAVNSLNGRIVKHFMHMFDVAKLDGVFPKMNKLFIELNESRNIMITIRSLLGLDASAQVNTCFKAIEGLIDACAEGPTGVAAAKDQPGKESGPSQTVPSSSWVKWNEIIIELCKLFECADDEGSLVNKARDFLTKYEEYKSVFPRVQHLLNQLRSVLGVDFAHEILPKVEQLTKQVQNTADKQATTLTTSMGKADSE